MGVAAVPIDGSGRHDRIRLRLVRGPEDSIRGEAEVRLGNPGGRPVGPVELRVDDLTTAAGVRLAGDAVRFDPPLIDGLAPGATCRVGVSVATDCRTPPGTYRGIIQAAGAPGLALTLEVELPVP